MLPPRLVGVTRRALALILFAAVPAAAETPASSERGCPLVEPTGDGTPVPIAAGERHCVLVEPALGDFIRLDTEQLGADLALRLRGPDGRIVVEADSPNGTTGREELVAIAETAGGQRLEIEAAAGAGGAYRARLTLRPASAADRELVAAVGVWRRARERLRAGAAAESLRGFGEALATFRELGDGRRAADALAGLSSARASLGEPEPAAVLAERAGDLYGRHGEPLQAAAILVFAGRYHVGQGAAERAVAPLERAVELYESIGRPSGIALAEGFLGVAELAAGRPQPALELLDRALERARQIGDQDLEAQLLSDLVPVLLALHRPGEAVAAGERAREIYQRLGHDSGLAVALQRLGEARLQRGEPERAEAALGSALELQRNPADRAVALRALGDVRRRQSDFVGAKAALTEGLELARRSGAERTEAVLWLELGQLETLTGDPAAGLALHDRAAERFAELGDRRGAASALARGAEALAALGRPEEAWGRLEPALDAVEGLRSATERGDYRTSFFGFRQDYYEIGIDLLMALHGREPEAGWDRAAFRLNERRLARDLVDSLSAEPVTAEPPPALAAEERRLEMELADLAARPAAADSSGAKAVRELVGQLHDVRGRLREARLASAGAPGYDAVTVAEVEARLLDSTTALLVFALGGERSYLWCLSADGFDSHALPGRERIEGLAAEFARLAASRSPLAEAGRRLLGRELTLQLLAPCAGRIAGRRLAVVAPGVLERLPFAALPAPGPGDAERFLVEDHEIVLLPSVTALEVLRRDARPNVVGRPIAAFADPVYSRWDPRVGGAEPDRPSPDPSPGGALGASRAGATAGASAANRPAVEVSRGSSREAEPSAEAALHRAARDLGADPFERLPHSLVEARTIVELAPDGRAVLAAGFEASRETLVEGDPSEYGVLHFATHALVHPEHPELSGLVLSLLDPEGRPRNGFLRAYEISRLRLTADLVVLSACESGIGSELRGEGMASLARSFFHAGARRVIATLWRVSDAGTAILMERFYRGYLAEGRSPAAALRVAQLAAIEERPTREPYYWAGFVFQGDWSWRERRAE